MQWRVLVPIKEAASAKTRLKGATKQLGDHAELVRAIQRDTLSAALQSMDSPLVAGVFVVTAQPVTGFEPEIEVLADPGGGLNAALAAAARELNRRYPADGVAAMVADLPSLRGEDLLAVLAAAPVTGRGFVRDADGTGTTLLAAAGVPLNPCFGPGSARRHLDSGAVELSAAASVRSDVDSAADLRRCLSLGVGPATGRMAASLATPA